MERRETDVVHFLFAKNESLIGRDVVRFRDISSGYRGCGCAPRQRKTQSGRTECRYGGGFGCARVLRSLFHPWHGRILRKLLCKGQLDVASVPVRLEMRPSASGSPSREGFLSCNWSGMDIEAAALSKRFVAGRSH